MVLSVAGYSKGQFERFAVVIICIAHTREVAVRHRKVKLGPYFISVCRIVVRIISLRQSLGISPAHRRHAAINNFRKSSGIIIEEQLQIDRVSNCSSHVDIFKPLLSGVDTDVTVTEIVHQYVIELLSALFVYVKVVYGILLGGGSSVMNISRLQ